MSRLFTLSEAEALLPEIRRAIVEAVEAKHRYDTAEGEAQAYKRKISMMGGSRVDVAQVHSLRSRRESSLEALKQAVEAIQSQGVEIKDLDAGLVDFPTRYKGRTVYLCWKLGEERIAFWHPTDEGFRGRRAIDAEFLAGHEGERPV